MQRLDKHQYADFCWDLWNQFAEEDYKDFGEDIQLAVHNFKQNLIDPRFEFKTSEVYKVFREFSWYNVQYQDKYVQFPMMPWEAFLLANAFGFYWKDTDRRKHKECLLFIAKKNGKTALASAVSLYMFQKDGKANPLCAYVAKTSRQALNALIRTKQIVYRSPVLRNKLLPQKYQIIAKEEAENLGSIAPYASVDPQRLDGPQWTYALLDEVHAFESEHAREVYYILHNGMAGTHNPFLFLATTAGKISNKFMLEHLDYHKKALRGKIKAETVCSFIFQPDKHDDVTKEKTWRKANPSLGVTTSIENLREDFNKAQSEITKRELYEFVTKRINIFREEPTNWLPEEALLKCTKPLKIEDFKGKKCYLGLDLSKSQDLSALSVVFGDSKHPIVFVYFFMANAPEKFKRSAFDLEPHIESGLIHKSDIKYVDYNAIIEKIIDCKTNFKISKLMYDAWRGSEIIAPIQSKMWCEAFGQGYSKQSGPICEIERLVKTKSITFAYNPVLLWNFENVVIKDYENNLKLDKNRSKDAIDGVAAMINAFGGMYEAENHIYKMPSPYK